MLVGKDIMIAMYENYPCSCCDNPTSADLVIGLVWSQMEETDRAALFAWVHTDVKFPDDEERSKRFNDHRREFFKFVSLQ